MKNIREKNQLSKLTKNRGQIWVETVIYTLIGLSIIGILLAFATPKINEMKDKLRINEAIDILGEIDSRIIDSKSAPGNVRIVNVEVSKGMLIINSTNDSILWFLESTHEYSEEDQIISIGDLIILTEGQGGANYITLKREYSSTNLTVEGKEEVLELDVASVPYQLVIKSQGDFKNGLNIDFSLN